MKLIAAVALLQFVFAQTVEDPIYLPFLNFGLAGAFILLFVLGRIVPKSILDDAIGRAEKAEIKLDAQTQYINERVIPLLGDRKETLDLLADARTEIALSRAQRGGGRGKTQ